MSRNQERLCLSSRYIHTGNSGVTFSVNRDVERVDRAEVTVENSAFGAFTTRMGIRGNDYKGMTAHQLRDLALMFMDAADSLDLGVEARFERNNSPPIAGETGWRGSSLPRSLEDFIPDRLSNEIGPSDPTLVPFLALVESDRGTHEESEEINGKGPEEAQRVAKQREKLALERQVKCLGFQLLTARRLLSLSLDLEKKDKERLHDANNSLYNKGHWVGINPDPREELGEKVADEPVKFDVQAVVKKVREALANNGKVLIVIDSDKQELVLRANLPTSKNLTISKSNKWNPSKKYDLVIYVQ
jgi:hypothetical protein